MSTEVKERTRKPRARHRDVILAAFDERMLMLSRPNVPDFVKEHIERLRELADELKRSLGKDDAE